MPDNKIIVKIISDILGVSVRKCQPKALLVRDLGMDSLDAVELVIRLEMEFNVDIPNNDVEKMKTVGDVITWFSKNTI